MGTSFDTLFKNQPAPPTEPAPAAAAPAAESGTSFDSLFSGATKSQATPEVPNTPAPAAPAPSGNSFDSMFKRESINPLLTLSDEERQQSNRPDPENNEDEPWYSKTWSWMNKPLWDLHQYGTRTGAGTFERGVESGAEDILSGLTSPLSIALAVPTLGEYGLEKVGLEGAAKTIGSAVPAGLRAVGVSKEAAPFVSKGLKSLMDLGFTAQNLRGLLTQSPQFLDALKDGDYETASRLGTSILAMGGMTAVGATQTFEDAGVVKDAINGKTASQIETLKTAKKIAGDLDVGNRVAGENAQKWAQTITEDLKQANALDPVTQGGIRKYIAAQGDIERLQHMHDAIAGSLPVRATAPLSEAVPNPTVKDFGSEKNFKNYLTSQHGGDEAAMRQSLGKQFDLAQYTTEDGTKVQVLLKSADQIPMEQKWNKDYVYHAADKTNADIIRSAGIGRVGKSTQYHETPEDAIANAPMPTSGSRDDLRVFAVPRVEAENASVEAPKGGTPRVKPPVLPEQMKYDKTASASGVDFLQVMNGGPRSVAMFQDPVSGTSFAVDTKDWSPESFQKKLNAVRKSLAEKPATVPPPPNGNLGQGTSAVMMAEGEAPSTNGDQQTESHKAEIARAKSILRNPEAKPDERLYAERVIESSTDLMNGIAQNGNGKPSESAKVKTPSRVKPAQEPMTLNAKRGIMPSHEIVIDNGKATGDVVPLRPESPYSLTLDNDRLNKQYTPAEKDQLLAKYKAAMNLTPEQIAVAKKLSQFYSDQFERANGEGIIRQAIEGYHPQAWAKDRPGFFQSLFGDAVEGTDNSAYNSLRHQTDNGAFDTNVNAAKHRSFESEFQGEMAGYKGKTDNLAYHAANYQNHLDRAIAARNFLEDMRASGAKASDGRPLVALQGSSKVVGAESGNPALLVNPKAVRGVGISPDLVYSMMQNGQLEDMVTSGKIDKMPFDREVKSPTGELTKDLNYSWNTDGYQTIDHPSMRDWQYIGKDTAGNNAMLRAQMRVHPEAAQYIRQVIGADKSVFRENPYLRTLMAAQRETKGALLSFSPFHAVQEGLRGIMLGINPLKGESGNWFDYSPVHIENDPLLRLGVRNNLTLGGDFQAKDMLSDGLASHSKLISKIPGANKIQSYITEFTFDKLIPNLKARAFKSVYQRFLDKMPNASADEVALNASKYVNDVFGGQHWRDLGVSTNTQDIMRTAALAPDWLTSEARMLYRAAGGMDKASGQIARQDMLRLTAGLYMTARIVNMLSTGKPHAESPFGLVVPGEKGQEEKVYSLRTLPTDLIHAVSDPRGFIAGRVNPLTVRTAIEGITQRNEMGQKVTNAEEVGDLARNFIPIGAQGLMKGEIPGGLTNVDQLTKAAGATVYRYRTEAENLAQQKASDHMPSGPVDSSELAKHQRNLKLEDGLRTGEVSRGQIRYMLPAREASQIIENAGMTGLQARFNRLPMKDALDVWALATPTEKDELHKLLWTKRLNYLKAHNARERAQDPTWQKMQSVYGDLNNSNEKSEPTSGGGL